MTPASPLILVDGSAYLYRAFHALPPLATRSGQPTGAVKGVINMLKKLGRDYPASCIAVIFDAPGKTFRDDIYQEYKAHRPPMPDDMRSQVEPIYQIVRALGLPLLIIEGVEADDVIGTLTSEALAAGRDVVVSTGDKDLAQLVNERVTLVNTMTDTVLDVDAVKARYGFGPEHMVDYLALMGDKIDNIPGIPGVGEKTAAGLIAALGSVDAIYADPTAVAGLSIRGAKGLAAKVAEYKDQVYLSRELATINCDVELPVKLTELCQGEPDTETLRRLYGEFEFKSWLDELDAAPTTRGPVAAPVALAGDYETVLDRASFDAWLKQLQQAPLFAFDTETTSLDYMRARIVGVSFAVEPGRAAYVPFGHDYLAAPEQLTEAEVLGALKPLLEDPNRPKLGQNLKYDSHVLANHGIALKGIDFDVMLESYTLNSIDRHDMDNLAQNHLGHRTIRFEDVAGKGAKQLTFNQVPLEQAGPYAAEDADITLRLHQHLWPQLEAQPTLKALFETIEKPLIPVLMRIEHTGTLIDAEMLAQQSAELGAKLAELEREAYRLAGREFNLGSPKQLGHILFEEQQIPVKRKTAKGAASTSEDVLQELAEDYPLPKVLIEHRGLAKLKSTYTDKLPLLINPNTGRVHTSYHQAVAATGRLSSSDPNLQNIPIRTEEGRRIRKAFVAPPGYRILAADYSQIELRIMAHLSDDPGLLHAFSEGLDVHTATASEVFGIPLADVSANQRRSAKAINFGLIYGMSAFGLAKALGIGRGEAQRYIDTYFERYPGVRTYMDATRARAAEQGYVETLCGRRLYTPEINSKNGARRQAAERTAINAPMQGTAADIIKLAMVAVQEYLDESGLDARMIMQVHDELVFEVGEAALATAQQHLPKLMSAALRLKVPLLVEVGVGANWDEAH